MNPLIIKGALLVLAVCIGGVMAAVDNKEKVKDDEKLPLPKEPDTVPKPDPAKLAAPAKKEEVKDDEPDTTT